MKNFHFLNIGLIIVFCFFLVSSISIQEKKEKDFYNSLPKIKDRFGHIKYSDTKNTLTKVPYNVLYMGTVKPEIKIGQEIYSKEDEAFYYRRNYKYKKGLKIIVDTTQLVSKRRMSYGDFYNASAYPVFLYNTTNSDLFVGYGSLIHMILEAKNENGEWRPIEKQYYYSCGTGIFDYTLKKDNICVTSVYKYKGRFKTKLRLRHLGNYSNEFEGYIDPNEFGKYKIIKAIR